MRLLVTGAGGQVGHALSRAATPEGWRLVALGRAALDVCDEAALERALDSSRPDVVINAAAYTKVDQAEFDRMDALLGNREGPARLAAATARRELPLVHLSTDYVFDGTKDGAYVEDDAIAPLGVYGDSKAQGEAAVRAANPRHLIVRTSWVYAAHGRNFVHTMLRVGRERDTLRIVDDQTGAPTSAEDIARALLHVVGRLPEAGPEGDDAAWGTYHYTAAGSTTWHGFARAIFDRAADLVGRVPRLDAIATSDYPTPARRPMNSRLDCSRIEARFAPPRRPWEEGLEEVIDAIRRESTA